MRNGRDLKQQEDGCAESRPLALSRVLARASSLLPGGRVVSWLGVHKKKIGMAHRSDQPMVKLKALKYYTACDRN
jgi:hypothetical protein